ATYREVPGHDEGIQFGHIATGSREKVAKNDGHRVLCEVAKHRGHQTAGAPREIGKVSAQQSQGEKLCGLQMVRTEDEAHEHNRPLLSSAALQLTLKVSSEE